MPQGYFRLQENRPFPSKKYSNGHCLEHNVTPKEAQKYVRFCLNKIAFILIVLECDLVSVFGFVFFQTMLRSQEHGSSNCFVASIVF